MGAVPHLRKSPAPHWAGNGMGNAWEGVFRTVMVGPMPEGEPVSVSAYPR